MSRTGESIRLIGDNTYSNPTYTNDEGKEISNTLKPTGVDTSPKNDQPRRNVIPHDTQSSSGLLKPINEDTPEVIEAPPSPITSNFYLNINENRPELPPNSNNLPENSNILGNLNDNNLRHNPIAVLNSGDNAMTTTQPDLHHHSAPNINSDRHGNTKDTQIYRQDTVDVNSMKRNMSIAKGFMDISLLTANANQLKQLLLYGEHGSAVYYILLFGLTLSLSLQIATGVMLIMKERFNVNVEKDHRSAERYNNATVILVFVTLLLNVFISSFGTSFIKHPNKGHSLDTNFFTPTPQLNKL